MRHTSINCRHPRPLVIGLALCAAAGVACVATTAADARSASAQPHRAPTDVAMSTTPATAPDFADLSAVGQARVLQPLRVLADALDAAGRGRFASSYTGVSLDATHATVDLYATDAHDAARLVATARAHAPSARWADVRIRASRFSRATLDAAATRLIHSSDAADLRSVSVPVSGTELVAQATASPVRMQPLAVPRLGVPVRVETDAPALVAKSSSWANSKWEDSQPFIGGDVLTSSAHHFCTAGLPAVNSSGVPIMITAAHCFGVGTQVYTAAGTPGAYGNGLVGNLVGTVYQKVQEWDAAEIIGANNNADESDTTRYMPLTSSAYSYDGDYVCQDGQASYFLNHPTPCGIKVTDDDIYFQIDGYWARGVQGVDVRNGWGSHDGDSGGTVFAVAGNDVRQARGIISSGGADGTANQKIVDWTEAPDIFKYYGLKLNPQT